MTLQTFFSVFLIALIGAITVIVTARFSLRGRLITLSVLAVWLCYAGYLGFSGIVEQHDKVPPGLALLTIPIIIGLVSAVISAPGRYLIEKLPIELLLGFQVYRVGVEIFLHYLWMMGLAPRIMTLEGGNIEILVALTAPLAAWFASRNSGGRRFAFLWNVVGVISLANIVTRAILSAPGPFQILYTDPPDKAILTFPFTFIPGFMAPLALALHLLAFRSFRNK